MGQEINPFLTKKQKAPHYRIDKSFYSKEWQQAGSDFDYDGYRNDGR